MKNIDEQNERNRNRKTLFEYFTEIIGWLQIFASPLLIGAAIAAVIYFSKPTKTRLIIAIVIVSNRAVIGIIWATRVWRRNGTIHYIKDKC